MTSHITSIQQEFAPSSQFTQNLDRLAETAVRIGLGLAPGQELVMTATLDAVPLARRITEHAYKAGASPGHHAFRRRGVVPGSLPVRRRRRPSIRPHPGSTKAWRRRSAKARRAWRLPATTRRLLSKEDPEKVSRVNRALSKAYRPALELIVRHDINWTIVACATPAWAGAVFPALPQDEAMARLWDAIFAASRADRPDAVAAWKEHDATLHARADRLNQKRYSALHFRGPGTDLRVGLADDHLWLGRRHHRQERPLLHPQYSDGRSLHHAAQGSRRRTRHQHQAALLPGGDDRRNLRPLRGRPHRRGSCHEGRAGPAENDRDRRRRAPPRRSRPGAALLARSPPAACSSSIRCSTRTPPATSLWARPTAPA